VSAPSKSLWTPSPTSTSRYQLTYKYFFTLFSLRYPH
jgi:hypothetical protein